MRLQIEPLRGLADEVPSVKVVESPPESEVALSVAVTDAENHRWESRNVFRADAIGTVDLSRDAPLSGSYESVDPTGPVWSMRFASEDAASSVFAAPCDQLEFAFTAEADGKQETATSIRRWSGPGVTRSQVRGDGFVGYLFEPAGAAQPHPAVAIIPGSNGPRAMEPAAALLASHGYTAMVVGYMGLEGLPATLCEVPLEALAAGIRWLAAHPRVHGERVGVLSASVGTVGALVALAEIPDLDVGAVVAIAPSSVIWQALGEGRPPKKSSWTLDGEPLPWVPMHGERLLPELIKNRLLNKLSRGSSDKPHLLHLLRAYAPGLRDHAAVEKAAIRAEKISAPILFLSGDDDQIWPGTEMAEALIRRRAEAGRIGDLHRSFADAGHFIRPPIIPTTISWTEGVDLGGTPEGNARANAQGWAEILLFLGERLRA